MVPPPELLEQALETHGDTLYRVALLLGADERAADCTASSSPGASPHP